jgi:two-component system, sensor histidine kinase
VPEAELSVGAYDASSPPTGEDAAQFSHLRRQQLQLLCQQWTRSPFFIAVAVAFVGYVAWNHASPYVIGAWGFLLLAILFARIPYARHLLSHPPADTTRALRHMLWFAGVHGLMIGAAAVLFFPHLHSDGRAVLTMVLVSWTGGAVATAAAYARAFHVFVIPALLPLAFAWGLSGDPENIAIAVMIVLFAVVQIFFVRDNERVVRNSFLIRYENERLLDALERERQDVILARDRAEEANRAKSRFLAAASHDLRQPLHALSLYSGALGLHARDGAAAEISRHINKALESLSALFDSLLDVSKLDAGAVRPEPQRVSVRELIERIEADYRPMGRAKDLQFLVTTTDAEVETDPVLFERLLRNLVDNAFKYTSAGSVMLAAEAGDSTVRIVVRDTGPGIPAAERERIFEEFYQIDNPERDRAQGLGLGLAIVRRLARLLGLQVELESTPGRGSTFAVTLSSQLGARAPGPTPPAATTPESRLLDGVHVLVIDDEPAVRVGMRTLLESWGCRVAACSGYAEAERLLDEYALEVDVIVADFRLREHENGIETVRRLRARLGDVPALLVSGDTAPERLREARDSGLPFLHKPVSADKLLRTIAAAVRR